MTYPITWRDGKPVLSRGFLIAMMFRFLRFYNRVGEVLAEGSVNVDNFLVGLDCISIKSPVSIDIVQTGKVSWYAWQNLQGEDIVSGHVGPQGDFTLSSNCLVRGGRIDLQRWSLKLF